VIPDKVRIPCYIVIIAAFVTLVKMVMNAYVPEIYNLLGVYLDLLVVNCIILGRAEMFAREHTVADSALDGLGMGLGIGGGFSTAMGQMTNNLGAMNQPAPTITCPKCGIANPSGAKFCANCGQTLQAQQGTPCPKCSQINPSGARFCANCGAPLAPQTIRCECGQENPSGARFCSGCGKKLGGE
ncbi:MAG: Rnf-Nqr domain containing protein, partial [Candidatus Enterosoma sp.]|nr:Rnf-Nqr domain containing protein [Candidatus Enterosoma sp.]